MNCSAGSWRTLVLSVEVCVVESIDSDVVMLKVEIALTGVSNSLLQSEVTLIWVHRRKWIPFWQLMALCLIMLLQREDMKHESEFCRSRTLIWLPEPVKRNFSANQIIHSYQRLAPPPSHHPINKCHRNYPNYFSKCDRRNTKIKENKVKLLSRKIYFRNKILSLHSGIFLWWNAEFHSVHSQGMQKKEEEKTRDRYLP